jgi:methylmalonyl-CoA mutase, N-terminal domain
MAAARSGGSAWPSRRWTTCARCSMASRSSVSVSMTINSTAAILLAFYVALADERGTPRAEAGRHDAERRPEGVHRARHLHLSRRAEPAARSPTRSRSARRDTALEPHLHQRLPHPRSGLDGCAGDRVHVRERTRVRARARAPGSTRHVRAATVVLLRRAQQALRGGREVPRGTPAVGAAHARAFQRAPTMRAGFASTRRPAASRSRRSSRSTTSCASRCRRCRHARRHAVAAHERVRRGARAAHGGVGPAGAAHAAGARTESGVSETIDPLGGSWYVESLTDAIEARARAILQQVEERGGAARALEWCQNEIHRSAYQHQLAVERGDLQVVGVNVHRQDEPPPRIEMPAWESLETAQRGAWSASAATAMRRPSRSPWPRSRTPPVPETGCSRP